MFEEIEEIAKKLSNKKVFVQIADGLKIYAKQICEIFEKYKVKYLLSLEPTYGACDLKDDEALRFNCDALVHIGHADFGVKSKIETYYVHFIFNVNEKKLKVFEREVEKIKSFKNIGIVSSLQYVKYVEKIKEILKNFGFNVLSAKTLEYESQILGCNVSAAKVIENKVDIFLVITEGKFYPVGLLLKTNKPVYVFDLEKEEIKEITEEKKKYEKIIAWNVVKFREAKEVGLLVSWKKGQIFFNPFKVKEILEKLGKKVYVFVMDEILPEKLYGINVNCLVNIACPRIFDDIERYKIPFINFSDLLTYEEGIRNYFGKFEEI
ncbi:MAG: diphthamide biosynthesis enzyme Dph2 [Candidatus Aenigmatarchaeota archaeon]